MMSSITPRSRIGLVLTAGGSRGAYQVGVLKHLAEHCPQFLPTIFTGVSSGSINVAFLSQGMTFKESVDQLYQLWENLTFEDVFRTNFRSLFTVATRICNDLFFSKLTKRLLFRSALNATPLASTLTKHVNPAKIWRAVQAGQVHGVSISATNYHTGSTTIFFDSHEPIIPWRREKRIAVRTSLRIRHIMASCSIPVIFEPVRIGDYLYGDGALRFSFPLSPAIHLGSTHVLAIGTDFPYLVVNEHFQEQSNRLGFILGNVLNSIFLDSLEADFENLTRINTLCGTGSSVKSVNAMRIRPSQAPSAIAEAHFNEIPRHFKQLMKTLAMRPAELGDILSYLMFSKGYLKALLELGQKDAADHHDQMVEFLRAPIAA